MTRPRIAALTLLAMAAFAGNSLLCRAALRDTTIDAASFTTIRVVAAAATLLLVLRLRGAARAGAGDWPSALALFAYAAGFSFAYRSLTAATGALLLFGAVQATMIGRGWVSGERLRPAQAAGLVLAVCGLGGLLLPGISAPPPGGALLMLGAGVAWGIYSLRGRASGDPMAVTAGNFVRAVPLAVLLSLAYAWDASLDRIGVLLAIVSGALASGLGYVVWYTVLPALRATSAATVQLGVPVVAALGGVALLGEPATLRLVLASAAVLGGIAIALRPAVARDERASRPAPSD
ncbi:MAG TPA: DMT family transporter [Xanthomonadales bacterium]|nr:DMT family transporter [Xanthomonadales bacterium]